MEKIINNSLYSISAMKKLASWEKESPCISETLYFSDDDLYFLYCTGEGSRFSNDYGTTSYNAQDLFILEEDDVIGWLDVHNPALLEKLFPEGDYNDDSPASVNF